MCLSISFVLKEHNRERKEEFLAAALRYIYATAFTTAEAEIMKDESVVLYSHERLGWKGWKYSPSEDIVIALNTTFGMHHQYNSRLHVVC